MGDHVKQYCLKCGKTLVDVPLDQCPTCNSSRDLGLFATVADFPPPPGYAEAAMYLLLNFLFATAYSTVALLASLLLRAASQTSLVLLVGLIITIFIWKHSLKTPKFISIMMLATGLCWVSFLAITLLTTSTTGIIPTGQDLIVLKISVLLATTIVLAISLLWETWRLINGWRQKKRLIEQLKEKKMPLWPTV